VPASALRAIVLVLDSVGIGELPDAGAYGDQGSHTLGNICRTVPVRLPALGSLGLGCITALQGIPAVARPAAAYGRMAEQSPGKDSVTGHWEIAGIVLERPFPTFPHGFPESLMKAFEARVGRAVLGNVVASGTEIIARLGAEHVATGAPIVYTSADSVFQVAAHEEVIPVPELYRICEVAYELAVVGLGLGRVIARPFVGGPGQFTRTANRRDFAMPPTGETLLDRLTARDVPVRAIGKIADLFAGRGIAHSVHTGSDAEVMDAVDADLRRVDHGLIFANLVDFDTLYGHRNDAIGYADNLARFDARLTRVLERLRPDDLLVVTADHGNDPTTASTDHSREYVPVLLTGGAVKRHVSVGTRRTFADLGQTLADWFGVGPLAHGVSMRHEIA
jgi:phosphopentomutase